MGILLQAVVLSLMVQATLFGLLSSFGTQKRGHLLQLESKDRDAFALSLQRVMSSPGLCMEALDAVDLNQPLPAGQPLLIQDPEIRIPATGGASLVLAPAFRTGFLELTELQLAVSSCGTSCRQGSSLEATLSWKARVTTGSDRQFGGQIGPIFLRPPQRGKGASFCWYQPTIAGPGSTTPSFDCNAFGGSNPNPVGFDGCINIPSATQLSLGLRDAPGRYPFPLPSTELLAPLSWEISGALGVGAGCPEGTSISGFTVSGTGPLSTTQIELSCFHEATPPTTVGAQSCAADPSLAPCYYQGPEVLRADWRRSQEPSTYWWWERRDAFWQSNSYTWLSILPPSPLPAVDDRPPGACPPGTQWTTFFSKGQRRATQCLSNQELPPGLLSCNQITMDDDSINFRRCQKGRP